ncbi:MAG: amidophosphoribosyltransferase [Bdellovibrionales bacterium]|nr:amidophosphoribosyltransferase [Bdellovibrionales bacterium]
MPIDRVGKVPLKNWHDECAIFGVWGDPEAGRMAYLGLYAQQHRGQESAGIVSLHDSAHIIHKGMGLVGDVFPEETLQRLQGHAAVGHTRYSTTGESFTTNIQPLTASLFNGPIAIAHNGNIVNSQLLRSQLKKQGAIFQGTNDTECLLHLLARTDSGDLIECLKQNINSLIGAFSLLLMSHDRLVALRDPYGFRPLVMGKRRLEDGSFSYIFASETCAFDLIGAQLVREIRPGELFWVDDSGEHSMQYAEPSPRLAKCIFEHVYFARPDSVVFGKSVYESRKRMGEILAQESPIDADMVVPVPDSGVPAAIGYSSESHIPFELGIIRNHYIGRTFIQPSQSIRSFGVKIKLNPQIDLLKGKRVIVIDDSLVRGTTSQKIIRLVRQAGAKEVHFRIASPPTTGPCFYGVDTPKKSQLIASHQSIEDIRKFIDADSLSYLSIEGMRKAVGATSQDFCAACFDGNYPTELFGLDREG